MPNFTSPSLFVDFSQLPAPAVIETIAYEDLLSAYKARVLAANPALAAALQLEQSATNIVLETEAYGEMLVRARVNAAARAVMLAFASGTDLDHLGALYDVARDTLPDGTPEGDTRYRFRLQLAPESFSTAGSAGAYKFQALTADPTIRDASPISLGNGAVQVAIMASGSDPVPTDAQLQAVVTRLYDENIKPLTDVVKVVPVSVTYTAIQANLTLYPGPDQALIMANVKAAIDTLKGRIGLIGRDLTRSAIIAALNQEGVQNVTLTSPAADIVCDGASCAWITQVAITVNAPRVE